MEWEAGVVFKVLFAMTHFIQSVKTVVFLLPNTDDPLVTTLLCFMSSDLCIMTMMVCLRICEFGDLSTWIPDT